MTGAISWVTLPLCLLTLSITRTEKGGGFFAEARTGNVMRNDGRHPSFRVRCQGTACWRLPKARKKASPEVLPSKCAIVNTLCDNQIISGLYTKADEIFMGHLG